jgi:indole-3-glycerol phosphate synthase
MTLETGTILDRIARRTASDLDARRNRTPLADLESCIASAPRAVPFAETLRSSDVALIAEIKRASPSKGPIVPDADALAIAADYLAAGASAISVLTDEPFFSGSLRDLAAVATLARDADPSRPVLRKDFLIDPYQIAEARVNGASAALLIVALLKGDPLRQMLVAMRDYGLEALVEVHDEAELEDALEAGAEVIGINNRDLRTFNVDLATTERLAPLIPKDCVVVAESGISGPDDVRRLRDAGASAILVGESLMTAPDRQAAVRRLIR